MTKAYSYLRFSTPEQQQGDSFRRQTVLAAEYARQHGLDLDTELTFQDLGVSAFRGRNAETGRLADFLVAIDDGLVAPGSFLLVESLDRISRQAARKALRVLEDIVERRVVVVTLNDGKAYTSESLDSDPMSLLLALLTFIRANEESATKSRRLGAAWAAKRAKAAEKALTSVCPAWLHLDAGTGRFEAIPERAEVVRRIYAAAAGGRGQNAIAVGLNRDKVPMFGHRGRVGVQWHRSYVVKVLSNAAVVGTFTPHRMEHQGGKKRRVALDPVPGYYPPVVDEDTYQRVQVLRSGGRQPLRGKHANGTVSNVLGGLARCPSCGGSMAMVTKDARWRYLICTTARGGAGCTYRGVRYGDVEDTVIRGHGAIIQGCPQGSPEGDSVASHIDSIDEEINQLRESVATLVANAGHVRSPTIVAEIVRLEREIDRSVSEQQRLAQHAALVMPKRLAARLDDFESACMADPPDRAAINVALRALLSSVVVDYRTGYLRLAWQHGGETAAGMFCWPDGEAAEAGAA